MPNRLASESSAYLLQHAEQPVDWYPWGPEALERARAEDRPILLSIGYAACHWCHRMAHESFSDPGTAALMNEGYINIKVDREERPDLDQLYQTAHQILRRSGGGWPLTVFLSPQGLPFYSGTYFPESARDGMAAFRDVLDAVGKAWRTQRAGLATQDQALMAALASQQPRLEPQASVGTEVVLAAREQLAAAFDELHGGFGAAPKFPHPSGLMFLLRRGRDEDDAHALHMALHSLRKMAEGGLYDQIGGGFFRYSVDAQWGVPHFEKMLSDNALLLAVYAEALALTGEPLFRRVVEDTVAWALREMQTADGGFCASLGADDDRGREGGGYVWQAEALRLALAPNEWDVCAAHWGLVDAPNFEGEAWHLRIARPVPALAATLQWPEALLDALIASARQKLLAAREQRARPQRDDKVLTGWNALMITGLARAAAVCQRDDWRQAARAALELLRGQRWPQGGPLLALPAQAGFLDDHAFLLEAVLNLRDLDPQADDLPLARALADALLVRFEDPRDGGFFFAPHDAPALFYRIKSGADTATPAGNGVAAGALQALGRLENEPRYLEAAQRCARLFVTSMRADPVGHARLLQSALSC